MARTGEVTVEVIANADEQKLNRLKRACSSIARDLDRIKERCDELGLDARTLLILADDGDDRYQ